MDSIAEGATQPEAGTESVGLWTKTQSEFDLATLVRQVDDFCRDYEVGPSLIDNRYRLNPQEFLWLDIYPRMPAIAACNPHQMLDDWRQSEWSRIVFLYFHFPFCAKRCEFCYYHISTDQSQMEEYLDVLEKEARAFLSHLSPGSSAGDLFFGGGTPSMVPPRLLQRFYDLVFEYIPPERIGMTNLEIHPRTMRRDMHQLAASGHVRRVSMGVQTFSKAVNDVNGRIWVEPEKIRKICTEFREAGAEKIGIDFMVGLYQQTFADVEEDLLHIHSLIREGLITSISVYPRSFTDNSLPLEKEAVTPEGLLEKFRQHMLYRYFFDSVGWKEGPMYLFTPRDFVPAEPSATVNHAHTAQALGFGNSARSTFNHTNYLNIKSYEQYLAATKTHEGATGTYLRLTDADANRRYLQFAAKRGTIDLAAFPRPVLDEDRERLATVNRTLLQEGLIVQDGNHLEVTRLGSLLIEVVHRRYEDLFRDA
jgi:coproporphyrinogen III oxidase-like Fe-S oxidoreductase